ncbi:SurA N-terminal domain-containing protein [Streptomyces sp. NPDC060194]|uniref:SurA N-terminal domain-containing protein n=1 Tax=Streptomyces sp. NPDC060194 TaxID=3347069 RepID=UPI00364E3FA9
MHRRRRTALALTTAVLAPLLAACGSEAHPGAAAVVGDQRITVAQLQGRVNEVREAQTADSDPKSPVVAEAGKFTRNTLQDMIFTQVLQATAAKEDVDVSRKEVRTLRARAEEQAQGAEAMEAAWLQQFGVVPSRIDESIRTQLLAQKLAEKLGVDVATGQNQELYWNALGETARELGVDVNPRYGTWDAKTSGMGVASPEWVRDTRSAAERAGQPEEPAAG